ncbi:hypothetical protein MTO96_032357 [Rhipicephalus appendiculatus]
MPRGLTVQSALYRSRPPLTSRDRRAKVCSTNEGKGRAREARLSRPTGSHIDRITNFLQERDLRGKARGCGGKPTAWMCAIRERRRGRFTVHVRTCVIVVVVVVNAPAND